MKKLFSICLIMLSMLLLVSCEEESGTNSLKLSQIKESYNKEGVSFSLDKGVNWQTSNNYLTEFDIWDVKVNQEVPDMVFFYATSYKQLEEKVKNHDLNRLLDTYNEEYFKDNILLYYYKDEPNISKNYVYNVVIIDDSLILNVNRFEGNLTALSSWLQIVTVKKEDVENITKFNVIVRTVSKLKSSITLYPNEEYIRDIFVNGLSTADFQGLKNLESVNVWTSNILVDINFNETITNERLYGIIDILKNSENIHSIGYTSNKSIRVAIENKFYDSYKAGTLKIYDILDNKIEDSNNFSMEINDFIPNVLITLEMEKHGKKNAEAMVEQLKQLNFPFINYEYLNLDN